MGNRRSRLRTPSVGIELLEVRRLLSHDDGVLTVFTRYGDADLDGIVNLADFNRLAANFGFAGGVWEPGDFNYDGNVNLSDFNRLAMNFGLSVGPDGPSPEDWAALAASIGTQPVWTLGDDGTLTIRGTASSDSIIVDEAGLSAIRQQNPR